MWQSAWPAAMALVLRWLLGDPTCGVLLGLVVLVRPWLGLWVPHSVSLVAAAATLTLLPARLPPGLCWLPADVAFVVWVIRLGLQIWAQLNQWPSRTFMDAFEQWHAQLDRVPLVCMGPEGCKVTFGELDTQACRVAWALKAKLGGHTGLSAEEPTALLVLAIQAIPALGLWLGLAKLGCPAAWINTHSQGAPLVHTVLSSGAGLLVVNPDLRESLEEVLPKLQAQNMCCFYLSNSSPMLGMEALGAILAAAPSDPVPAYLRAGISPGSPALYIYTSGTTGLPKAVILTHEQLLCMFGMLSLFGVTGDDVIYTVLPLHHVMGLVFGVLGCLELGAILAPKFSASCFWDDCWKHGVTVIYVGEILQYLCNGPQQPKDRKHMVCLAVDIGLWAEVWKTFQQHFGPIQIWEGYGSTEDNSGFVNHPGHCRALGKTAPYTFLPTPYSYCPLLSSCSFDTEAVEAMSDDRRLCIPTEPGEAGLLVTRVTKLSPFMGYRGPRELLERKLVRDVRHPGDVYYNTGGLLATDREGFLYFLDCLSDTFR
uniref:Long-chain-fatty-acid--CoA ligase n=1 Tax=Loxodonta africana TaxID=9785 RepID=G3SR21_LOXAF